MDLSSDPLKPPKRSFALQDTSDAQSDAPCGSTSGPDGLGYIHTILAPGRWGRFPTAQGAPHGSRPRENPHGHAARAG